MWNDAGMARPTLRGPAARSAGPAGCAGAAPGVMFAAVGIDEQPVALSVGDDGVARLRLDAPGSGNAIGPAMAAALRDRTAALRERGDVRVVVLEAAGRAFCVGGDVRHFAAAADPGRRSARSRATSTPRCSTSPRSTRRWSPACRASRPAAVSAWRSRATS